MRVAMIPTPELASEWGSTLHAKLLIDRLAAAGVEVVAYCRSLPERANPSVRFRQLPLPVGHPVLVEEQIPDSDLASFTSLVAEAVVADHAGRPFDLVHAHYATITGLAGLWVKTLCGPKLVISSFGRDIYVGAARDARYRRMVELTVPLADGLVASDEGVARQLIDEFGASAARVSTIPMGIDDRLFSPENRRPGLREQLARGADHLIVNVSSCFGVEKGIRHLLHATKCLTDRGLRVSLVIVGADDHEDLRCERELRELAQELGLGDVVAFCGRVPHREIPAYLGAADAVVDPRVVGSFSSVVLEALFSGAYVVASDVDSSRGWLSGGEHGVLHRAGDADDLGRKLERILTDGEQRARIRRAVADWPSAGGARLTADHMRDRILEAYRRALASG